MKFFVYYRMGSCNYGSCSYGLNTFDTLVEAEKYATEVVQKYAIDDARCTIIAGWELKEILE